MNDLIDDARVEGCVELRGRNVYDEDIDTVPLLRKIAQVFQKPNPFPKAIYGKRRLQAARSRKG